MDIIEEKCDEPGDDRQLIRHEYLARHLAFPYQRQEDLRDLLKRKDPEMCEEEATSAAAKYLLAIEHYVKAQDEHYTGLCLQDMLRNPDFLPLLIPAPATVEVSETPTEAPVPPEPAPIQEGDEVLVPLADVDMPPAEENEFVLPPALPESASEALDQSESQILRRVAELKKEGLWSESRMPLCVEPLRNKTHWDYLLEEVVWMARDFHQERRFKISACRKLILHVERVVRLKRHRDTQTVQKDVKKAKKHCAQVAKIVRDFWRNVNKVVDYKAQEILECRKRKALDEQLNFIVGQADKLSTIVKEGLTKRGKSIRPMTRAWTKGHHDQVVPEIEKESDNESTMSEEEKELQDCDAVDELALLASEAAKGYEELLAELPAEYLALHGLPVPAGKKIVEEPSLEGNGDGRGALKHVDYDKLNSLDAKDREQELEQIAEQVLQFQPRGHTLETTQVKTPVPFLIRGTLREYQMVGLDWLVTLYEKNLNGILADEMGLGKTIQTIALLAHLAGAESVWGPHLIIVPTSVILNWEMELKKWCPALKILTYFGTVKERAEKRKGWLKPNNFHVVIGSYQTVTQDIRSFKCRSWQYMILDEAQNIKNWKSRRWQWLLNIRARRRLLLTGTPLQNSLMELWSLMHFLMPSIFGSRDDFKDWFNNPLTGMMEGSIEYNGALVQRLHKVLRPFILRRMKNEVEKQLPAKTELAVSCQLSKRQRFLYDDYMSRRDTRDNLKTGNTLSVLNIVMQLRKCCNHPNLFEPRSVQSPFFHPPVKINIPAMFFDIVTGVPEEPKPIPACLDLRRRAVSCKSQTDARIPKLKELKQLEPTRPPKLAGFYLKAAMRPVLPARIALNDARSSSRLPAPKRSLELNPSFKSYTANFPLAVQPVKADGFNCVMAESGVGEGYKFSPPLKLRKKKEVISQYNALVPEEIKAGRTENRRFRLKLARARFETNPPLIAQELLDSVQLGAAEWTIDIQSDLGELQEIALKKFSLFVEPVQVDSPIWTATSAGRNVHVRWGKDELKLVARRFLEETDPLVNARLLSSRLQFPETRLIEYDCGKLQTLALLLRQLHLYKHRCLIFTQMSRMLDILQAFLSHHGYTYFRLDGSTSIEQRQQMMEQFNADSRIFCFILSTRSGGVGINLTGADTVIFYDSDWNPTMDAQAQDRCHRIGQTKDVTIYRLISESTIEENILKKARQKRRLGEVAIDEAGFTPEFFKQTDNIRDLFEGQTVGLEIGPVIKGGPTSQKELEAAMAEREDPQDREAMSKAAAEAGIDTAEFLDADKEKTIMRFTTGGVDPDDKYLELIGQLKPIERYAVDFLMAECMPDLEEPTTQDSIAETDEEPEPSRELSPDGLEEDIYACGSILDEIETFPDVNPPCPFSTWYPRGPSPEGDIYYNICLDDRYEREFMEDARLPTQIHDFPNYLTKSVPPKPSLPIPPSLLEPVLSKPTKKRKGTVTKGRAKSAAVTKTKAAFLDELPTPKKTVRKSTTEKSVEASDSSELTQLVKIRKQDAERQNKSLGPVQMAPTMPKKPLFPMHLLKKQTSQESFATPPPPTIPQHQGPKTNVPPKPKMSLSPLDDILPEKKKKLVIIPRDPRIDRGLPKKLPEKPPTLQRMIPISSEVMPPQFERKEPVLGPFNYPPPPLIPWHSQSPVYPPHLFRLPPPPPSDSFVLPPAPQHHGPKTNIPPRLKIISQNPLDELLPPEDARRQ